MTQGLRVCQSIVERCTILFTDGEGERERERERERARERGERDGQRVR